jgi:hypothetical protein
MVDTLNELASLSRSLNEKSDKLNSIISSINVKLAKLNFGVEAWLYDDAIEEGEIYSISDEQDSRFSCHAWTRLYWAIVG